MPGLTIGDSVPNLEVETTHGVIKLHDYIDTWTILFSHPGCVSVLQLFSMFFIS
jgi:1-Cys peroxiredoxin 6